MSRDRGRLVRAGLVGVVIVGVAVVAGVLYAGHRALERTVSGLAALVAADQRVVEQLEREVSENRHQAERYRAQVRDLLGTLRQRERQAGRLDKLERAVGTLADQATAGERLVRAYASGVALIQGTFTYEDRSGRPLRYLALDEDGRPVRTPLGVPAVSLDGLGPIVRTTVLGTGFLVSRDGRILTSRHVVRPREDEEELPGVVPDHVEPRVTALRAFFPDLPEPVPVAVLAASETADVLVLKGNVPAGRIPVLPLDRTAGDAVTARPVIVIGYPTGLELLLARVEPGVLRTLLEQDAVEIADDTVDVPALLERLSRLKLIRPYVTWGHLVDVRAHQLAYDAETALGGSGGPILTLGGRVVGVSHAMMGGLEGARFGVPIRLALPLLGLAR